MTYPLASVLCPTDLSKEGDGAVALAFALTRPGGVVHLLHVDIPPVLASPLDLPPMPMHAASPEAAAQVRARIEAHLKALVPGSALAAGVRHELHVLGETDAAATICKRAQDLKVEAIVMGTHGRGGLGRLLMGSVASSVAHRARLRVILARPGH